MPVKKTQVNAVSVTYKCDSCGNHDLVYDGILASGDLRFVHSCPGCGVKKDFAKAFPAVVVLGEGETVDVESFQGVDHVGGMLMPAGDIDSIIFDDDGNPTGFKGSAY